MARKGARVVRETGPHAGSASAAWREAVARARAEPDAAPDDAEDTYEVWVRTDEPEAEPEPDYQPSERLQPRRRVPAPVLDELTTATGDLRGRKLADRLGQATNAYEHERYPEARRILTPIIKAAPSAGAAKELYGLTLYRMGHWRLALKELEAARALTGSYDQLPVMMDCLRALRRYRDVKALWDELREASPSAEVVAEGRIVMAGALADQGDLPKAINLLERTRTVKKPSDHHLRQWYALADLYERAGDIPRARDTFNRIASIDRSAFDTRERLRALR